MRRLVAAIAALLAAPASAAACGMPLAASLPRERALVSFAGGHEEIVVELGLAGDRAAAGSPPAAVVFPVPGDADVDVYRGPDPFAYLERVTAPAPKETDEGAAGGAPRAGGGVDVLGREVIAGYDIARLRADDPDALERWLDGNGYTTPDGAQPVLASYVRDGWRFVAVKLAEGQVPDGPLKPLQIGFESNAITYPRRLDSVLSERPTMELWVASAREAELPSENAAPVFAGAVKDLAEPPPAALRKLLAPGFLTRFSVEQASDTPTDLVVAAAVVRPPDDGPSPGSVVAIILLAGTATGGVALILWRRRRPRSAGQ